jgi:hypothetical protein
MDKKIEKYRNTLLLMKYGFLTRKHINNLSEYEFDKLVKLIREELN